MKRYSVNWEHARYVGKQVLAISIYMVISYGIGWVVKGGSTILSEERLPAVIYLTAVGIVISLLTILLCMVLYILLKIIYKCLLSFIDYLIITEYK